MKPVSWLLFGDLADSRSRFSNYYHRLTKTCETPESFILTTEPRTDEEIGNEIHSIMTRNSWHQCFLRGEYKAAPENLETGSYIKKRDINHIMKTVRELKAQLERSPWKFGENIILRELLSTDFCMKAGHVLCHPEIRYVIEGGDVLGKIPDTVSHTCKHSYSHLESVVRDASPPDNTAQEVADEFDSLPWVADFVLDENGDWYCIELNLNGVRTDDRSWRNICGYGSKAWASPEIVHSPVLQNL